MKCQNCGVFMTEDVCVCGYEDEVVLKKRRNFDPEYRQWKKRNGIPVFHTPGVYSEADLFNSMCVWFSIVIAALMIFIVWSCNDEVFADVYDSNQIADAIYVIEGAERAKKPFGILSVNCEGYKECRTVCLNTIENNFTRWQAAGNPGDFLEFLGNRYAPPSAHPLNKNWLPNLRQVLTGRADR